MHVQRGKIHPGDIAEAASLASIELPAAKYPLFDALGAEFVETGKLSKLQLEGVMYACQKHCEFAPDGKRAGFMIGDGIGTRGSRSWATIHPGFMSAYANYGLVDFENNGGKLKAAMNSQASKDFHKQWVKMISSSGPANWSGYTWYEVGNDIGAGASAMIFDADILGYFFNGNPDNKEAGNFGFHGFTPNPSASAPTPNVWIWSLAMSNFSKKKDAAWYWMQWCNGPENAMAGGVKHNQVNPVRESVWASGDFDDKIRGTSPGYMEQYNSSIDGSKIHFTAQPLFFETTTEWAAALQEMQTGSSVDETLDKLASKIDRMMKDVGLA